MREKSSTRGIQTETHGHLIGHMKGKTHEIDTQNLNLGKTICIFVKQRLGENAKSLQE